MVNCLILLKSPHPPETAIYLMLKDQFSQDQVDAERLQPGSSIMDYTYNEKVILRDRYFGANTLEISFAGHTDNNDAFQFAAFITEQEANECIQRLKDDDPDFSLEYPDYDYRDFMHQLFPMCFQE